MFDLSQVLSKDRYFLLRLFKNIHNTKAQSREHKLFETIYQKSHSSYLRRLENLPKPNYQAAAAANLPIYSAKDEISRAIAENQVLVISGETGSGKTTQIPQFCLSLGLGARGMIACTQPRRIAARSVAFRIAEELGVALGKEVGWKVRFDDKTSDSTCVKLMTDGILLAEIERDRYLSNYEVIIIDEAHERSLNIDFLLGYLKKILPYRPDLKLIITSATIDAEKFSAHFGNVPHICVSGRSYPVEIVYRSVLDNDEENALLSAINELYEHEFGDILIFLPTEKDIRETLDFLNKAKISIRGAIVEILPLFGRLSAAAQAKIFKPGSSFRIILATNVAETSITVPRIKYVIDTGFARISRYSLKSKTQRLPIEPISQSAAKQRAGRCGRISAGICIRLYSEEDFYSRSQYTEPEILRTNLAAVILQMLNLKLGNLEEFPFIDPPDRRQITDGMRLLFELKAINKEQKLTADGRKMAQLSIDPRYARIILEAQKRGVLQEILIIVAVLSLPDPRERPFGSEAIAVQKQGEFADKYSDFQTFLNIFASYRKIYLQSKTKARNWCQKYFLNFFRMQEWYGLFEQLKKEVEILNFKLNEYIEIFNEENLAEGAKGRLSLTNPYLNEIHKALLSGFLDQVGLWDEKDRQYCGCRNRKFSIFPSSVLAKKHPQSIVCAGIIETSKIYAHSCAPVNLFDLEDLADHLINRTYRNPQWFKKAGNVLAQETLSLYGLVISSEKLKPYGKINPAEARDIFIRCALMTAEIETKLKVIQDNNKLIFSLQELEDRTRTVRDLRDEEKLFDFYNEKLPLNISSVVELEQWVKKNNPEILRLKESDLSTQNLAIKDEYPEYLVIRGQKLYLEYEFNPGGNADGVSVLLPLSVLNSFESSDFERLIPAMFLEKITALLRHLPKIWRRQLVPIPDFAKAIVERIEAEYAEKNAQKQETLAQLLSRHIFNILGIKIPLEDFDESKIDQHLLMNFRLYDDSKKDKKIVLAEARDLAKLQEEYGQNARETFAKKNDFSANEVWNDWILDEIPEIKKLPAGLVAYPALYLDQDKLILKLFDNQNLAKHEHERALVHLFALKLADKIKYCLKNLAHIKEISLIYRKISDKNNFAHDFQTAVIKQICLSGKIIRKKKDFLEVLEIAREKIIETSNQLANTIFAILDLYGKIETQLRNLKHKSAKDDMFEQLNSLVFPGFISNTKAEYFVDILRYLKGIDLRIKKLINNPLNDAKRLLEYNDLLKEIDEKEYLKHPELFYLLQEYRLQLFAQEIERKVKISAQIIRKKLAD